MQQKRGHSSCRQLREIIALWEALHAGFERAVRGLPDAALGFRPQARMRTLGQLVRHTLVAESYYFSGLPRGRKSRPTFPKKFKSKRALLGAMQLVHKRSLANLRRLSDEDLDRQLRFPWLPKMSVRQVLLYVIAHEVHHRAQLYTYIHLWEPPGRRYSKPWWVVRGHSAIA
jgi:uncharacterized damage-inducible protein DinB